MPSTGSAHRRLRNRRALGLSQRGGKLPPDDQRTDPCRDRTAAHCPRGSSRSRSGQREGKIETRCEDHRPQAPPRCPQSVQAHAGTQPGDGADGEKRLRYHQVIGLPPDRADQPVPESSRQYDQQDESPGDPDHGQSARDEQAEQREAPR